MRIQWAKIRHTDSLNVAFSQTGADFCTQENAWPSKSDMPKMKWKIFADYDMEVLDDETT